MKQLSSSINLTKLRHKMITYTSPKSGAKVKGIFIPVDHNDVNDLVKGKDDTWYMPVRIVIRDEADQFGQHGFIAQSVDSKKWKNATEAQREEYRKKPILGNIKDFRQAENDGNLGSETISQLDDDDDLPW